MSLATLKTKVERLIDKAQSDSGESTAIDYPEHGFTRPDWWLPRPETTGNSGAWVLYEFPAEFESYNDGYSTIDLSDAPIVKNGRKQKWGNFPLGWTNNKCYLSPNGGTGNSQLERRTNYAVELFLDYGSPISLPYHYQRRVWQNLKIISGTTLGTGIYHNDGFFCSRALKVVDCHVLIENDTNYFKQLFGNTALEKAPDLYADNGKGWDDGFYFQNCYQLRDGGRFNGPILVGTAFSGDYNLEKVSFSAECFGFNTNTFSNCTRLEYITVDEGFASSLYIHHSTQFTAETLHALIENFADMSTAETAPTFQIGETNIAKIDEDHIAMLEAKNWNYL